MSGVVVAVEDTGPSSAAPALVGSATAGMPGCIIQPSGATFEVIDIWISVCLTLSDDVAKVLCIRGSGHALPSSALTGRSRSTAVDLSLSWAAAEDIRPTSLPVILLYTDDDRLQ